MKAGIAPVIDRFPDFRVAVVITENLALPEALPSAPEDEINAIGAEAASHFADTGMGDIPSVAVWRKAYRVFGIKKTSCRCSVER